MAEALDCYTPPPYHNLSTHDKSHEVCCRTIQGRCSAVPRQGRILPFGVQILVQVVVQTDQSSAPAGHARQAVGQVEAR